MMSWLSNLTPEERNYRSWPTVDDSKLSPEDREVFLKNRAAVERRLDGDTPKNIHKLLGVPRQRVDQLLRRCLMTHKDMRIWGYRALVPRVRVKIYTRTKPLLVDEKGNVIGGEAGLFMQFLNAHPDIKTLVEDLFLGRKRKGEKTEVGIAIKDIHQRMLAAAEEEGLSEKDYPFCTKDKGLRSLTDYLKGLFDSNYKEAVRARHGKEIARRAGSGELGDEEAALYPYQQVEIDLHVLDGEYCVFIDDGRYGLNILTVMRPNLLAMIDRCSEAALAHHLVLKPQPSQYDVLRLIKKAIQPWVLPSLEGTHLRYNEGAGMPSEVYPWLEWALWDETYLDNALYFTALHVQQVLTEMKGGAAIYGRYRSPNDRPNVENLFKRVESELHRFSNTTGSHHDDFRKNNPKAAAVKYDFNAIYADQIIASVFANYNGKKQDTLGHRSPLQVLELMTRNDPPRLLLDPDRLRFLQIRKQVTVRGNTAKGDRPYIQFENAKYSSPILGNMPSMIGQKLDLEFDPDRVNIGSAFLETGEYFDQLRVKGRRLNFDHTIEQRKLLTQKTPVTRQHDGVHEEVRNLDERTRGRGQTTPAEPKAPKSRRGKVYKGKPPLSF